MTSHVLDPVLELAPAYDEALLRACLEGPGAPWYDVAVEAQEVLWSARACHVDRPAWIRLLARDLGHWVRGRCKIEADERGVTWIEVAQGRGIR